MSMMSSQDDLLDMVRAPAKTTEDAFAKVNKAFYLGTTPDEVQEKYNAWHACYDHDVLISKSNQQNIVAEHLAEYMGDRKDAKIVDAAAGTGLVAARLHQLGYTNITALDANAMMLEEAKKKNIYNDYICAWMGNVRLPIPDDTFDALCMSGAFCEGLVKPDCLLELIRIVKPGGYMVIDMVELEVTRVEACRNKLEPEMKFFEDKGLWKMMLRKLVPNYIHVPGKDMGIVFCFQVLEGKHILGTD